MSQLFKSTSGLTTAILVLGSLWAILMGLPVLGGLISFIVYLQLAIISITLIVTGLVGWHKKRRLTPLIYCMTLSLAVLLALSLAGFCANSTGVGEFDGGGTWVPNHALGTALRSSWDTPSFIGSLFGFSCNTAYGSTCSRAAYRAGFATTELILAAGLITAAILRRHHHSTDVH